MALPTGSDWNAYAVQHGKAAVRQLVRAELRKQEIELPAELAKQATVTPAVTRVMRDVSRQRAG